MNIILLVLKKEMLIAFRRPAAILNPLLFFILILTLFPLAITSDPAKLMQMGPGIVWVCLLFANMLSIETVFSNDFEDGTLEQMLLHSRSFSMLISIKLLAHWLITTLPLLLIAPLLSQFFFISFHAVIILFISILLGSPVLTLIAAMGSALTLGLQNRGILIILLVLPLYLPILIFGAGAVNDASIHLPVTSHLAFLAALLTLSVTFLPMAIAAALKISLD